MHRRCPLPSCAPRPCRSPAMCSGHEWHDSQASPPPSQRRSDDSSPEARPPKRAQARQTTIWSEDRRRRSPANRRRSTSTHFLRTDDGSLPFRHCSPGNSGRHQDPLSKHTHLTTAPTVAGKLKSYIRESVEPNRSSAPGPLEIGASPTSGNHWLEMQFLEEI